jgi:retron-type reverse transcriptase
LYCERWLKAPVQLRDGTIKPNQGKGTPQGGVISPILANIFLDSVFDKWIKKHYPDVVFERYADDIVVHCRHIKQALRLLEAIKQRLKDCKLELNREKSKIVYCCRNQKKQPPFKVHYQKLVKWERNKYSKLRRRHWYNSYKYLKGIANSYPNMFVHWQRFMP